MIETFLIALFTLLIGLYLQARKSAREIRRNREADGPSGPSRLVIASKKPRAKAIGHL